MQPPPAPEPTRQPLAMHVQPFELARTVTLEKPINTDGYSQEPDPHKIRLVPDHPPHHTVRPLPGTDQPPQD